MPDSSYLDAKRKKELILLLSCILIGFALRFFTFNQKSLWMDEVYTFNDSRDDLKGQIEFYKKEPTYLHPPLFFILTHQFYPFTEPERDVRIIPVVFGTLSIPMIYLLSRLFSPSIALPCTLSLTFMVYHISLSQDGRSYALLLFLGMAGIYFFLRHLQTSKRGYLLLVASFFSASFFTSYSSILLIVLSQILWFYRPNEKVKKPVLSSVLTLNGLVTFFCLPWVLFIWTNLNGRPFTDLSHGEFPGTFWYIFSGVLHDWVPHSPLMVVSIILLALLPFFSRTKRNALILLSLFILPIGGLYLYCKLFHISHFVNSRYFITFFPVFLIILYLSLDVIETRIGRLNRFVRPKFLFAVLFISSNVMILPLYYQSEKQNFKGLAHYLKNHLREGDNIFVAQLVLVPGILHYFGRYPEGRHYQVPFFKDTRNDTEFRMTSFIYGGKTFSIYHSKTCCTQYMADGSRLWIIAAGKWMAKQIKENSPCAFMGYFDGSFLNYIRFPTDASIYLFLWDPKSPDNKGIDISTEQGQGLGNL